MTFGVVFIGLLVPKLISPPVLNADFSLVDVDAAKQNIFHFKLFSKYKLKLNMNFDEKSKSTEKDLSS